MQPPAESERPPPHSPSIAAAAAAQAIHPSSPRFFFSSVAAATPAAGAHRRVAIAVDLSDESAYAVEWAVQHYLRPGDAVVLLHVRPTSVLYGADWGAIAPLEDGSEESQQKLEDEFDAFTSAKAQDLAQPLVAAQIPFKIHIVKDHDMKERLCLEVERLGLSAVIMGSRGFGAARRAGKGRLGSVSDYCVHHCVCPVVVVRYPDDRDGGADAGAASGAASADGGGKASDNDGVADLLPVPEEEQEYHDAQDEQKVLSATGGIKVDYPKMSSDVVIVVAVIILVGLFSMQHYGTDKVGWLFAPVVLLWFILIGVIGLLNILKHERTVLKACSPVYIVRYFRRGRKSWTSLGGILLSITGTEALFADLSHFPVLAIQIAFTVVVFPCLVLAYAGQAAYILKHKDHVVDAFYRSIPEGVYWPMFIIATAAAVIASQATISATFSIIKQALALGCFPRVKVVHTSKKFLGQIYIPDINWILMVLCIAVTAGFKNQNQIGNAYGTAVVIVMLVTTFLMVPIMLLVWRSHWILVTIFTGLSLLVELAYFSAVLFKIDQGGWVPLVIAAAFLLIMLVWHYGTVKRYEFEMHSKVSMAWILGLGPSLGLVRVPGIGFVYTELASGVPHIFSHFITNLPAIHSVLVFVCVKYLPVYTVPQEERFLVKRIGPKNFHMFRCVARYGYKDLHRKDDDFEKMLFDSLTIFVRLESMMEGCSDSEEYSLYAQQTQRSADVILRENYGNIMTSQNTTCSGITYSSSHDSIMPAVQSPPPPPQTNGRLRSPGQTSQIQTEGEELDFLNRCRDAGVVHILGNTIVRARRDSGPTKKLAVDYIYAFLRRICRENSVMFNLPHESLLNVGQIFYV